MPVMSCSSKTTKAHFEKHVIITTIITSFPMLHTYTEFNIVNMVCDKHQTTSTWQVQSNLEKIKINWKKLSTFVKESLHFENEILNCLPKFELHSTSSDMPLPRSLKKVLEIVYFYYICHFDSP